MTKCEMTKRTQIVLATFIVALMLTVPVGSQLLYEPPEDEEVGMEAVTDDKGILLAIALSVVIGVAIGYAIAELTSDQGNNNYTPASDDTNVKAGMRGMSMMSTAKSVYDLSRTAEILVNNDSDTWALTQSYFNRASEISASTLWSNGATSYDASDVLLYSGLYKSMGNSYYNIKNALDYGIRNSGDQVSSWNGVNWGTDITSKFIWTDKDNATVSSPEADSTLRLVFDSIVTTTSATQTDNQVYLLNSKDANGTALTDGGIWAKTNGTLKSLDGSVTKSLVAGYNNVDNLASGIYTLSQGTYAGMFLTVPDVTTVTLTGGAVLVRDVSTSGVTEGGSLTLGNNYFGFITTDGTNLTLDYNGYNGKISDLAYSYTGDGYNGSTATSMTYTTNNVSGASTGVLDDLINAFAKQISGFNTTVKKTATAGEVMWMFCQNTGSKCVYLSPSSMSSELANVGIDADQSYAIYASALNQISTYYQNNKELIENGQVSISETSLKLYCLGNLYNENGVLIAENVIFTPYTTVNSMTVSDTTLEAYNKFSEDATCMIWKTGVTSITDFTSSDITSHQVVVMPQGAKFSVTAMKYNGELVHSTELTVKEISQSTALKDTKMAYVDSAKVLDADIMMLIIIVELGLIIALIGVIFRQPIIIIIGGVVVILGIFFSEPISELILGWLGK